MRDQGCMVDCVYCSTIHPEIREDNTKECPMCHGQTPSFRPMRMMDKYTSEMELLHDLFTFENYRENPQLKDFLISLLTKVQIYNFDLKEALISKIQAIEYDEECST
jgi:predicted amidophosphoribosyltransferase